MAAQKIDREAVVHVAVSIDRDRRDRQLKPRSYFMARTQLFLLACGITESKLRFRQHNCKPMLFIVAPPSGRFAVPLSNKRTFTTQLRLTS